MLPPPNSSMKTLVAWERELCGEHRVDVLCFLWRNLTRERELLQDHPHLYTWLNTVLDMPKLERLGCMYECAHGVHLVVS